MFIDGFGLEVKMGLSDSIKKAAQQQVVRKAESVEHSKKGVNLGSGRTSNYGYNGVGRPTNEGYEGEFPEGQAFME